jgi:putative membrane protein
MKLILRIFANAVAILIAAKFIPGFVFSGAPIDLLIAGAIIGIVNAVIKPVITFISLPVIFFTLGIFYVILNVILLLLAAKFIPHLTIHGFWPAFWGVVIISFINSIVTHFGKSKNFNNY